MKQKEDKLDIKKETKKEVDVLVKKIDLIYEEFLSNKESKLPYWARFIATRRVMAYYACHAFGTLSNYVGKKTMEIEKEELLKWK